MTEHFDFTPEKGKNILYYFIYTYIYLFTSKNQVRFFVYLQLITELKDFLLNKIDFSVLKMDEDEKPMEVSTIVDHKRISKNSALSLVELAKEIEKVIFFSK